MTTTYAFELINCTDLTATDLRTEITGYGNTVQAFRVRIDDKAEQAQGVYLPQIGRAGIAWGADAQWTDCSSIEDCIERYLSDDMIS